MHVFFFNDTATTEIYTLSLHDALPIFRLDQVAIDPALGEGPAAPGEEEAGHELDVPASTGGLSGGEDVAGLGEEGDDDGRSEEHTSELQSRQYLVCRLLLEKKTLKTRG